MFMAMCRMENNSLAYLAARYFNIRNWLANQLVFCNVHKGQLERSEYIFLPTTAQKAVTPVTKHSAT
jgi:hypothetical protein